MVVRPHLLARSAAGSAEPSNTGRPRPARPAVKTPARWTWPSRNGSPGIACVSCGCYRDQPPAGVPAIAMGRWRSREPRRRLAASVSPLGIASSSFTIAGAAWRSPAPVLAAAPRVHHGSRHPKVELDIRGGQTSSVMEQRLRLGGGAARATDGQGVPASVWPVGALNERLIHTAFGGAGRGWRMVLGRGEWGL